MTKSFLKMMTKLTEEQLDDIADSVIKFKRRANFSIDDVLADIEYIIK